MAFRTAFDCLWCGAHYIPRGPGDIEGWAHLCQDCIGRAGDNAFLRFRLKRGLDDRAAAADLTRSASREETAVPKD